MTLKKLTATIAIAISILGLETSHAYATPELDQSFEPIPEYAGHWRGLQVGRENVESAQTFTVGTSGTLTRVDVQLGIEPGTLGTGNVLLDIRPTSTAGNPKPENASALITAVIPATDVTGSGASYYFVEVDLGDGLQVSAGSTYTIVLRSETPNDMQYNQFIWASTSVPGNDYNGGASYSRCFRLSVTCGDSNWELRVSSSLSMPDLGFRTYVEAGSAATPEPETAELDQSFEPAPEFGSHWRGLQVGRQNVESAQTFTVGTTGILTQVDVQLGIEAGSLGTGDVLLDIRPTDTAGNPETDNASALITAVIPAADITGSSASYYFVEVNLGAGIRVTASDTYAIVLRSETPDDTQYNQFIWASTSVPNDNYDRGASYYRCFQLSSACGNSNWELYVSSHLNMPDLGFRTYIEADTTIPEPSPVQATFFGLGSIPVSEGRFKATFASAVSNDGQYITGSGWFYPDSTSTIPRYTEAFRWSRDGGIELLGDLPGGSDISAAYDISADGKTVVGTSNSSLGTQAFKWTEIDGMVGLSGTPNERPSYATGVSADGNTMVGSGSSISLVQGFEAFRITDTGLQPLGGLADSVGSYAADVSADGSAVVGRNKSSTNYKWQAFLWTPEDGMTGLGFLQGEIESIAKAISADKSTVVGTSHINSSISRSFRWTKESGMIALNTPNTKILDMSANDVSANGSKIVGQAALAGKGWAGSFLWTKEAGAQDLHDILEERGIDLTGWVLSGASAISDDGNTIVGWGINPDGDPEAWVAVIPTASVENDAPDEDKEKGLGTGAFGLLELVVFLMLLSHINIRRKRDLY